MAISRSVFLSCLVFVFVASSLWQAHGLRGRSGEDSLREADRVRDLPGQPAVTFRHYAGYVKLRSEDEKALFYWFFEAEEGVEEKPLVLWLNGGPGCSSIAFGAAQELGPFLVRKNQAKLELNKFSWNKAANLLFLEAPVGVGFSYTNKTEDLEKLGDRITAEDSYAFLVKWFQRFPSFKSHDFYITGESYAGHYVPQLSELIYERNKHASNDSHINFKGFMIGNAVINDATDQIGMIEYAWSHAIISDQLYHHISKECNFKSDNQTNLCASSVKSFLQAYSDIDIYSIYTPICLGHYERPFTKLLTAPLSFSQHDLWHKLSSGYDACTGDYAKRYFNREDVQKALHANVTKLSYSYTPCSDVIKKWNDSTETVLPIITKLIKAGLSVWIYSGDTDGRVPVTSTRYSVNELKLKVQRGWRAWFVGGQVAGWVVEYEGLTLATVRGAGHQVPAFAPEQSLSLLSHFLSAHSLPTSRF
ncbi:serine carboxypeptidase-like 35 [Aristolochia californica]|uniref:serine carboxypeptidase-like 35 n=1 Tax=Aristolochia californica TaxID=171875 RepID=UPI0035DFAFC8